MARGCWPALAGALLLSGAIVALVVVLGRGAPLPAVDDGGISSRDLAATEPGGSPLPPTLPPGEESRLLGEAIRRLRQEQDLGGALRDLEGYLARFPRGALRPEAEVARVEALLGLGRRREALDMIDQMNLTGLPRARELRVLRGELLVEGRKLERALVDFEAAQTGIDDEIEERAIFGQASCLAVQGEWAGSRAALDRYLSRFPSGKYAEVARRGQGAR